MGYANLNSNERLLGMLGWELVETIDLANIQDARALGWHRGDEYRPSIDIFQWEWFGDLQFLAHQFVNAMDRPDETPLRLAIQKRQTGGDGALYISPEVMGESILEVWG